MSQHVLSVIHRVNHLASAQNLLTQVLDFNPTEDGNNFVLLSNGALNLRLILDLNNELSPLYLDVSSTDLAVSTQFYCQQGFSLLKEKYWLHPLRQEIQLKGNHHLYLTLYHDFNEDELNILPDLPITLTWHPDAIQIIQTLLTSVPLAFRDQARLRIVDRTETEAVTYGLIDVDQALAIKMMIRSTPDFQLEHLKDKMLEHDLVIEDYFQP
jgi:hypothetical protein